MGASWVMNLGFGIWLGSGVLGGGVECVFGGMGIEIE